MMNNIAVNLVNGFRPLTYRVFQPITPAQTNRSEVIVSIRPALPRGRSTNRTLHFDFYTPGADKAAPNRELGVHDGVKPSFWTTESSNCDNVHTLPRGFPAINRLVDSRRAVIKTVLTSLGFTHTPESFDRLWLLASGEGACSATSGNSWFDARRYLESLDSRVLRGWRDTVFPKATEKKVPRTQAIVDLKTYMTTRRPDDLLGGTFEFSADASRMHELLLYAVKGQVDIEDCGSDTGPPRKSVPLPARSESPTLDEATEALRVLPGLEARIKALESNLAEANDVIRNRPTSTMAAEYKHVGNNVDVLGKSLPFFGSPNAPKPAVGYDLSAWRAVLSVGTHKSTADAVDMIQHILRGESVRLIGAPSVGKTSAIREVAAAMGAVVHEIDCGEGKRDCELIGEPTIAEGQKIVFKDGEITAAVRCAIGDPEVMHFIVLDEIDHLQPEVQSLLHSVLDGGTLSVDGSTLVLPDNLRVVATANTTGHGDVTGRHAAARLSDTAFLSRWNITMTVDYMEPSKEAAILNQFIGKDDANKMVAVAGMTRSYDPSASMHVSNPIALRQLLAWARASAAGTSLRDAFAWTVLATASDTDQPIYADLALRVFDWD